MGFFQDLKDDLSLKTQKAVDEITQRNEEVEKLYGLFGKNVTCGNLKQLADNENKIIWGLYISSLVIMLIVAICLGISIYLDYQTNDRRRRGGGGCFGSREFFQTMELRCFLQNFDRKYSKQTFQAYSEL